MNYLLHGLRTAWHEIATGDPYLLHLLKVTLEVAGLSTAVAVVIGLPLGTLIGLGRFRGRTVALMAANVGLGLPPVLVGLILSLLMFPRAPLGRFRLLYTLHGVYIAQSVLAVPIVIALTAAAVRSVPQALIDQARALGARRGEVWLLALRESRVGVLAGVVAAVGSGLSEVGAVVLVGGNIYGADQTLASALLEKVDNGSFADAIAIGILLLGLIVVVTAALTVIQFRGEHPAYVRPPS